jgi:CheY-like chemotaxis protein
VRLELQFDETAGAVAGDADRLQQVLWNLLSNAVKFTPAGGRVEVRLERREEELVLSVSDTGRGIAAEFLPYVFARFRQAENVASRSTGGVGLGLAIVRHLVELHGGIVEAHNRADQPGAAVTVTVPLLVVPAATPLASPERVHPVVSGVVPFDCPPELKDVDVVAVDDDPDARRLVAAVLEDCGAVVRACASAGEAMTALAERMPDVLVSDIGMPEEDGYAFIRRVRARGFAVPAVALTAYARVEDRMQALSSGYNMHVPKPVEPAELAVVVASLVHRRSAKA